jgi:DNA-directed RNA polymerase specialized sigma24 family protein
VQMRMTNSLLCRLLQRSDEREKRPTQADLSLTMAATGAPAAEIARVLGTTANTVKVALSRDKRRQRENFGEGKDG